MATPFIDFRPAQVMGDKEVYVCYYVIDPTNDKLKRMRIRCNRIKSPRERTKYATLLCSEINRKLYNGWNPLVGEDTASTKRVSIVEAATDFVRQKEKDLRKDTVRSYRSKLSFFTGWCEKAGIADWLCGRFTSGHAADILDENIFSTDFKPGGGTPLHHQEHVLHLTEDVQVAFNARFLPLLLPQGHGKKFQNDNDV